MGEFTYSPIVGTHILSGILVSAIGQSVTDFATENLFLPLGINAPQNVTFSGAEDQSAWYAKGKHPHCWVSDPQGIHTASWGLTLTPTDMAKIGQLYLNDGVWHGRQIVSSTWIDESTKEHSRWMQMNLPYGYLWWLMDESKGIYAAMGDGGNVIYINPQKQLVIAIASLFTPNAKDGIDFIRRYIEPAV